MVLETLIEMNDYYSFAVLIYANGAKPQVVRSDNSSNLLCYNRSRSFDTLIKMV
jgi:hypothetical protein